MGLVDMELHRKGGEETGKKYFASHKAEMLTKRTQIRSGGGIEA